MPVTASAANSKITFGMEVKESMMIDEKECDTSKAGVICEDAKIQRASPLSFVNSDTGL